MAASKDYGFSPKKDIREFDAFLSEWFNAKLNQMHPIGSIVILMDTDKKNPASIGYPGTWRLIEGGHTLVCRGTGDWDKQPGATGGDSESAHHTHNIFATEKINEELPNPEWLDDRRIYADVLDGDSDQCNQEASTGPCYRYLLHSDDDFEPPHKQYQLIKTYKNYVWANEHDPQSQIGYANPIEASYFGEGSAEDPGSNYPPYTVVNIWKRIS